MKKMEEENQLNKNQDEENQWNKNQDEENQDEENQVKQQLFLKYMFNLNILNLFLSGFFVNTFNKLFKFLSIWSLHEVISAFKFVISWI